jgi:Protein of unknown function (DUF3995)
VDGVTRLPANRDPLVRATALVFGAAAAVHVAWGLRVDLPGVDRDRMAEAVVGSGPVPGPAACFAVAGLLKAAAALVLGFPRSRPGLVRAGRGGVALALGGRALLGLTGRTGMVAPGELTDRFRRWDRRVYTPLCLALAAGTVRAAVLDAQRSAPGR